MKQYLKHWPTALIVVLTLIGGFLRLFKIEETVMFLGDQGRDALIVADIFREKDPVFIGPVTSVGNMYLGPLYYYFMLPFLWMSYPSPLGPVVAVAVLGTATIPLLYYLFKRWLGISAALLAAFLLTFNAPAIQLSRFSWNPNLEPFVSVFWLYFLIRASQGKLWYWFWVAVAIAVFMQLHYVALITAGVSGLVWLNQAIRLHHKKKLGSIVKPTLAAVAIVLLFQLPLVLFDLRHDGLNWKALQEIVYGEDAFAAKTEQIPRVQLILEETRGRAQLILTELLFGEAQSNGVLLSLTILVSAGIMLAREQNKKTFGVLSIVLTTLISSILVLSVYKNDVYTHYVAFLIPPVVLLYGYVLTKLGRLNRAIQFIIAAFMLFYALGSYQQLIWKSPGPSLSGLQTVADSIHSRLVPGERYAILVLSEYRDTYGMNYRYYLSLDPEKRPVEPEELSQVSKMLVIQEDMKIESPLTVPLYELQVFDIATPSATWDVTEDGPRIFVLEKSNNSAEPDEDSADGV